MSNPTFKTGPITFECAAAVSKFRVVQLGAAGVQHCTATTAPFGAVAVDGAAKGTTVADGDLTGGLPTAVAVLSAGAALPLAVDAGSGAIALGANVFAAADGKVSATGTASVGVAIAAPKGATGEQTVTVLLTCPNPADAPAT